MSAPANFPVDEKWHRMNLPKREELLFLVVLALPNAFFIRFDSFMLSHGFEV